MKPRKFRATPTAAAVGVLHLACLLAASAAHATVVTVGSASPTDAQYYTSQAYGEIKDPADNTVAQGGRFANFNTPVGPANESGALSAAGSGLSYTARSAMNGFALANSYAAITVSGSAANYAYNAVASQGSRTQANFVSTATPGQAVFHFSVSGTSSTPLGAADGRLDFLVRPFATGTGSFFDVFLDTAAMSEVGPGNYSYTYTGSFASPLDILFYSSAYVLTGSIAGGLSFGAYSDFESTFDLAAIELFDLSGQRIDTWQLEDLGTGRVVFNQDGRVAALVPEPTMLALLGIGFAGLGVARRRQGRPG